MSTRSAATKVVWFRIPILFLLVVCADSCVGINPMSSPKANRDMKRFYEEGTEAFAAEDYQRAVNNYSRALDISSGWLMLTCAKEITSRRASSSPKSCPSSLRHPGASRPPWAR